MTDAQFTAFVSANYDRMLHIADLMIGSGSAEDLLQNVLTRLYQRWDKVDQAHLMQYVRAALANARTDRWRRLLSRQRSNTQPLAPQPTGDHAGAVVGRDAVQRALSGLTVRERAVVVLRYYEDLSEAEIARTLGIAPGTVKSTCSRALSKLRISPEFMATTVPSAQLSGKESR